MESAIDNAFLSVGVSCPKPLRDTGILCGSSGGVKQYCWFKDTKPKPDRVRNSNVVLKSQVNLKMTDYKVQFTIKNYDCVNPRVTLKYRPIDNDGSTEYMSIYDDDNALLKTCTANIQKGCSEWFTCTDQRALSRSRITVGSSYTFRVRGGPDINSLCTINGHKLSMDAIITLTCDVATSPTSVPSVMPTVSPSLSPTYSPSGAPSQSPTASPVHNTYITEISPNGDQLWHSTSTFLPEQSSAFGQIRIGHRMSAQFDFAWTGRTNTPRSKTFENFFRIGFDAQYGTGCSGQSSRYPALWLTARTNQLYLSLSQRTSCTKGYTLPFGEISQNMPYRMAMQWDDTLLYVEMQELEGSEPQQWNASYSRDATSDAHIGAMAEVWWMSSKFGTSEYNIGGGRFWNITFESSLDTTNPTVDPTTPPTMPPSADPTASPTLPPLVAVNEWVEGEQPFAAESALQSVWTSTTPFIPQQSSAFGEIRIGRKMSATFDFVWSGRTNNPRSNSYEMFFRVGFDSDYGNGCNGQNSRYPALWLTSGSDRLAVSISEKDRCSTSYVLDDYGEIVKGIEYHMEIAFDDTSITVQLNEKMNSPVWSTSFVRSGFISEHIGQYAPIWWMSGKFGSSQYNVGGGVFSNIEFQSEGFTT